jgi:2-polyprenyl-6-methoxyphenol hydroxylase-like FAD-dependent oxidoreductase
MNRVIIVGAGPGGATLAYLLARRGLEVVLFERHADFAREFRGEVLMPSGLVPFREMGLWDELDAVPHVTLAGFAMYLNGKLLARGEFDPGESDAPAPRWTSQPQLLEMLVAQSARFRNSGSSGTLRFASCWSGTVESRASAPTTAASYTPILSSGPTDAPRSSAAARA